MKAIVKATLEQDAINVPSAELKRAAAGISQPMLPAHTATLGRDDGAEHGASGHIATTGLNKEGGSQDHRPADRTRSEIAAEM